MLAPSPHRALFIVRDRSRQEEMTLDDPSLGDSVVALGSFVAALAERAPRALPLSELGVELVLRGVISEQELPPALAAASSRPGFVPALRRMIDACIAAGVPPEGLGELADRENNLQLHHLSALYAALLERLSQGHEGHPFTSPGQLLTRARAGLSTPGWPEPADPSRVDVLVVVDPLDITVDEGQLWIAVAHKLAREGRRLELHVPDLSAAGPAGSDWAYRQEVALPAMLFPQNAEIHTHPLPTRPGWIGHALTHLHQGGRPPAPMGEANLHLVRADTTSSEVRWLSSQIKELIRQGVAPEQIAVAAADWEEYLPAVGHALDEAALRWRPPGGPGLLTSPVARITSALPRLVQQHFPREGLLDLLGGDGRSLLPLRRVLGEGFDSPSEVASLLRQSGVQRQDWGGLSYTAHLRALARALRQGKDLAGAERAERLADALQALFIRLSPLGGAQDLRSFVLHLRGILEGWGLLPARALEPQGRAPVGVLAQLDRRATARDQAAGREISNLLSELARVGRQTGGQALAPGELSGLLQSALAQARLPVRGARGATVVLLPLHRLAGRRFEHVFLIGMSEGAWPPPPRVDALLPDDARGRYHLGPGHGAFLDTNRQQRWAAATSLHLALACAERATWVSWPRTEPGGAPLSPSPWVEELGRVLHTSPTEAPGGVIPALDSCHTLPDLCRRTSALLFDPPLTGDRQAERSVAAAVPPLLPEVLGARWQGVTARAQVEALRLSFFLDPRSPGDGWVGRVEDPQVLRALGELLPGSAERPISASKLEVAARCRFQFLARHVLKIDEPLELGEELDSRDAGTLTHFLLERLYRHLASQGLLPVVKDRLEPILAAAGPALEEATRAWEQTHPVIHPGLFAVEVRRTLLRIMRLLRAEAEEPPSLPLHFELSFGPLGGEAPLDALKIPSPDGARHLHVQGTFDRVDQGREGPLVIDYKSSSAASVARRFSPREFGTLQLQIPIYLLAARQLLPQGGEVDAALWSVRDARRTCLSEKKAALAKRGIDLEQALEINVAVRAQLRQEGGGHNVPDRLWALMDALASGDFRVKPADCEHCPVSTTCRVLHLAQSEEEL